jgi:predicted RNase H-like HicB family nuclease
MRAWKAPVEITPWPEGGFVASVPSLQGCWVVAGTPEDALRDVYEVISMSIASRIEHGEPLPPDIEELAATGEDGIRIEVAVAVS